MNKNIDFSQWFISKDCADFGQEAELYEIGWHHRRIESYTKIKPIEQWKTTPYLNYIIAYFKPNNLSSNDTSSSNLSEAPKELQQLFLQFFHPELKQVILKVEIKERHRLRPITLEKEYYKFLLSEFWVHNNIFNKFEVFYGKKCLSFFLNWEAIFTCIWTNYSQLGNRPIISQIEFINYLCALRQLATDTIAEPLNKMDDKNYKARLPWITSNTDPEDCQDLGMHPDRWQTGVPTDKETVFLWRVEDAKDYLNFFLKKYNSTTVQNALEMFLVEMFKGFGRTLEEKKILTQCGFCGEYFIFKKNKKYCSQLKEKKDCGKQARNKRHYSKHKEKIKPKAQKTTKELRSFYRQKGVKK